MVFGVAVLVVGALQAADIETVQQSAVEWSRVRGETARLESDWQWQKQLLAATNATLTDRIHRLEAQRDELAAKSKGDKSELDELAAKNAAATTSLASAEGRLKRVTAEVLQLRGNLPPRLSQALDLPYRSLGNATLTPSERMLYLTTILNRCAQFNKTITYADEPVALGGSSERTLLNVIYWGLGQAYALDRVAGKAYVGHPGANGWTWDEHPEALKSLAHVIAINQEKADPDFVELPATLAHTGEAGQTTASMAQHSQAGGTQ